MQKGEQARTEQLRRERRRAAHRNRRIIYDNDGGDAGGITGEPSAEALLAPRTRHLLNTQTDSVFYCTSGGAAALCWHDCRVPEVDVLTRSYPGRPPNVLQAFIAQGTDTLRITLEFCHANGLEVFSTVRMNDNHDANHYIHGQVSRFKLEHPEWLFGALRKDPSAATADPGRLVGRTRKQLEAYQGLRKSFEGHLFEPLKDHIVGYEPLTTYAWSQADFAVPEVRDLVFRIFEDLCSRYDVDGISMDFLRHPPFFRSVAWGQPVSAQETEAMTSLVRRIRAMTEEISLARGRPLLLSARVLDSVELNAAHGLDVECWLREDLIDLMVSGWVQAAPIEEMIALGHRHDAPVYVHLNCGARFGNLGDRARAMHAWRAGADGVYMFNYFPQFKNSSKDLWSLLSELGDPRQLQGLEKLYSTVPFARTREFFERYMAGCRHLIRIPLLEPGSPQEMPPGGNLLIPYFPVGDDVLWGSAQGITPDIRVRIGVADLACVEDLTVRMNNHVLRDGALADQWLTFRPAAEWVRAGNNRIEMELSAQSTRPVAISDLQLRVRYSPAPSGEARG